MVGGKLKNKVRVQASTILEVIISMVIILVVFGIAMMISANVLRSSLSVKKIKARALLNELLIKAENSKENTSQTFTIDRFRIEQEIIISETNNNLIDIHLTAFENQEKIDDVRKLILDKHE